MWEAAFASLWTAMVLFVLYDTSAVYHYLRLLPFLNFVSRMRDYESRPEYERCLTYSDFMLSKHPSFLVELSSCRYCMGFWLSVVATGLVGDWEWLPLVFFLSQLIHGGFRAADAWLSNAGERG